MPGQVRLEGMATRKGGNGKVTETVKRLLAIETSMIELRGEVAELRHDFNVGIGKLLAGLERLEKAIDRVAEIRPRLDALEVRVTRLEQRP